MGATVTVETCGGFVRKGRGTLPDGTEVETGETHVNAGGARKFVSGAWTPHGIDDAEAVRAKHRGEKPPLKWAEKVAIATKRQQARVERAMAKVDGVDGPSGGTTTVVREQKTGLAAQLEGFEDDPEMQQLILKRWNDKRAKDLAEKAAASAPVKKAAVGA